MSRAYTVSQEVESIVHKAIQHYGLDLKRPQKIAENIHRLSSFFIENPLAATPWDQTWAQIAYFTYFLPLNSVRIKSVGREGLKHHFFNDIESAIDFGCGPATATLALREFLNLNWKMIEKSPFPKTLINQFTQSLNKVPWTSSFEKDSAGDLKKSLVIFSYSYTEIKNFPSWALAAEALMIVEPSTQQDGRRLLELREFLKAQGYSLYAPCIHQDTCPLQVHSQKDWCHDRISFIQPDWFQNIEAHLPMRNQTLTMSYLLARKTKPQLDLSQHKVGRTVGDKLVENGKSRQLVCRSSEREYLTWLHRNKNEQNFSRGILIEIPDDTTKVANEIRIKTPLQDFS